MIGVTFVLGDDWEAMYVNGRKVFEGHSISGKQAVEALNAHVNLLTDSMEVDYEWLTYHELPENLGDIPQEVRI